MANNIFTLDDGTREITVVNTYNEEICKLHIRAGDIGILDRYKGLLADVETMFKPLESLKINNDGTSEIDEDWETIKGVERELIAKINALFDMKDADALFKNRNAFSTVNGVFYAENVLDMLGKIVSSAMEEEGKKREKRIQKYTEDLKKG